MQNINCGYLTYLCYPQSAYVNGLQGEDLFASMFVGDVDAPMVELIPDVSSFLKK